MLVARCTTNFNGYKRFRHWADAPEQENDESNNCEGNGSDYGNQMEAREESNGSIPNTRKLASQSLLVQAQAVRFRIEPASSDTDLT